MSICRKKVVILLTAGHVPWKKALAKCDISTSFLSNMKLIFLLQLTDYMVNFSTKSRRQRINQRNRVERLSPLLDWKNLGIEYSKARQLALRRAYPEAFEGEEDALEEAEDEYFGSGFTAGRGGGAGSAFSVPGSPRLRGAATPGDMGTLTEEVGHNALSSQKLSLTTHSCVQMQSLNTADFRGSQVWNGFSAEAEEDSYP